MPYPTSSTALVSVRQDSDGTLTENYSVPATGPFTHRLGASLAPALPTGWQLIPKGAFPISAPAAPTGTTSTVVGGLVTHGNYIWALTNCTDYGETVLGVSLHVTDIGVGTAYTLTLPFPANAQGTTDAPVRFRRLYRTTNGGASLLLVAELRDLAILTYNDLMLDTSLTAAAPTSNTSGIPAVVTLAGSATTWVESAPGTTLTTGLFVVDYSYNTTGGIVTHAGADAGKAVTVTYTAATLVSSAFTNGLITAIKDVGAAAGVANGLATLDGSAHVLQVPVAGIRSVTPYPINSDFPCNQSNFYTYPDFNSWRTSFTSGGILLDIPITISAGSTIMVEMSGFAYNNISLANWISIGCAMDYAGPAYAIGYGVASNGNAFFPAPITGRTIISGLSAGSHQVYILGAAGGTAGATNTAGFYSGSQGPSNHGPCFLNFTVTEFA